jgi:hypothetical protein
MKQAYNQFIFLMTEKLDESLLMLKNAWGWTLQDILYQKGRRGRGVTIQSHNNISKERNGIMYKLKGERRKGDGSVTIQSCT